ncbi:hypothetical protein MES4922_30499 [Mesorhizobium ventifaucium]|uniref:Uncharacterized protein n=1 Tax=Mesorhizobium ventifaucium TaxID=666020 RepID=A0ABN8JYV3_9HYPH|nr:hypothetical protein MES4922_30499 [Mesorhizobium ventifaucium]
MSVLFGSIFLRQSLSGIDHTPLLGPYSAAQREINGDATVLVQQLIRALQRVLGSFYSLSGLGHFEAINFKHFPASCPVAVPSIVVNRRRSRLFRPRPWLFPAYKRVGDCRARTLRAFDTCHWRREWDSNPRWACTHAGFQDRCLKPLGHPSIVIFQPLGCSS